MPMARPSKREKALLAQMRAQKEELRKRIDSDHQLRKDFEFQRRKEVLTSELLLTKAHPLSSTSNSCRRLQRM